MQHRNTFLAATLLAASALSAPAFASGTSIDAGIGADAAIAGATANAGAVVMAQDASGGSRIDTQATASTGGKADVRSVMSAIGSNGQSSATIRRATKVKAVEVIDVSNIASDDNTNSEARSRIIGRT